MKHRILYLTVVLVVCFVVAGFIVSAKRSRILQTSTKTTSAADDKPLKDRVRKMGNFAAFKDRSAPVYESIAALAYHSTVIAIGEPQDNISKLTTDGLSATIDYTIRVKYVYKGAIGEGDTIKVAVPGGKVKFRDGNAEVRTPWFKKLDAGKTYLLFLQPSRNTRTFETTGESQGVFEIPTSAGDRTVKSSSGMFGDPIWRYHGMNVQSFLREVRRATSKT